MRRIKTLGIWGMLLCSLWWSVSCDDDRGGATAVGVDQAGDSSEAMSSTACVDIAGIGAVEGAACDCGGAWACIRGSFVCEGGGSVNACGGCQPLSETPNQTCGVCDQGRWTCSGTDALVCQGEGALNVCGGCSELFGSVSDPCGTCGTLECQGAEELICVQGIANACGGCDTITETLGGRCGECGVWACDDRGSVMCDDPGAAACMVNRFILMGDTGEANEAQYRVAAGAQARCDRAGGCEGFIMLGDNIYDTGPESSMDQELTDKIDLPYANLKLGPPPAEGEVDQRARMPIYAALGNHDLGGAGLNSVQVNYYLEYARAHDWFYYPSEYWERKLGHVHLISIHTNPLAYSFPDGLYEPQGALVDRVVEGSTASWKLVFGHHPYRSNGQHGNAGAYEGLMIDFEILGLDISGHGLRRWVDEFVCNRVDFFISGHDHNRQWLRSVPFIPNSPEGAGTTPCNTYFAVSGAGAKTTDFQPRGNDLEFGDDLAEGFLYMAFHRDRVEVEFCDADGRTEWSKVIQR